MDVVDVVDVVEPLDEEGLLLLPLDVLDADVVVEPLAAVLACVPVEG